MSGLLRAVQLVGGAIAIVFLVLAARSAWTELAAHPLSVNLAPIVVSTLLLTLVHLGMVGVWAVLLGNLGVRVPYAGAVQLWSFSNLGRYLPGKIWQVVGLAVVARDLGIPAGVTTAAAAIALALMLATGALTGFALSSGGLGAVRDGLGAVAPTVVAISALGLVFVVVRPGVVTALLRRLPASLGCADVPVLSRASLVRLAALYVVNWLAQGAAFFLFARAFGGVPGDALVPVAGAYALAYVGGLAAVFAPGGIGVREGLLGYLLAPLAGDAPVHLLAVAARLWSMAAEILVLALALGLRASRRASRP